MNCNFKKRMWLAGASLLAIVLGSGDANAVVFGTGGSEFVIPATGFYDFSVGGAQGSAGSGAGTGGGNGALVGGELFLDAGTTLGIIAGGLAGYGSSYRPLGQGTGGGGGGGSFVFNVSPPKFPASLLFAAGGGGGNAFGRGGGGPGIGGGGGGSGYGIFGFGGGGGSYGGPGRFVGPKGPYYTPNPAGYFGIRASGGAANYVYYSAVISSGRGQLLCGGAFGFSCRADGEDGGFGGGGGSGYSSGGGGGGSPGGAGGNEVGAGHGGYSYVTSLARDTFGITGGNSGAGFVSIDFVGSSVPEPSTWAMMLAGFSWLGGMLVRRGRKGITPT
jgi:PEP-CTERM motif